MNTKFLAWMNSIVSLIVSSLLVACTSQFEPIDVTKMPIVISLDGQKIAWETIRENVEVKVQEYVPGAYMNSLTYIGSCEDVSKLYGSINIGFIRVEQISRNQQQIIYGIVSVNTHNQTMEMHFDDHSTHYLSTSALTADLNLEETAIVAQKHIEDLELSDCDVTLTYLNDAWLVVCTELGSGALGERKCKFEVDNTTLEIQEPE